MFVFYIFKKIFIKFDKLIWTKKFKLKFKKSIIQKNIILKQKLYTR